MRRPRRSSPRLTEDLRTIAVLIERSAPGGRRWFAGGLGEAKIVMIPDETEQAPAGALGVWRVCIRIDREGGAQQTPAPPRRSCSSARKRHAQKPRLRAKSKAPSDFMK
jgi:hypothetical protein